MPERFTNQSVINDITCCIRLDLYYGTYIVTLHTNPSGPSHIHSLNVCHLKAIL